MRVNLKGWRQQVRASRWLLKESGRSSVIFRVRVRPRVDADEAGSVLDFTHAGVVL
jgi:hypothetical protein